MPENEAKTDDLKLWLKPRDKEAELRRLASTSQFAGISTAVGVVLIVGTMGYSMWQLNRLDGQVEEKQAALRDAEANRLSAEERAKVKHDELQKMTLEIGVKQAAIKDLDRQVEQAKKDLTEAQSRLDFAKQNLQASRQDNQDLKNTIQATRVNTDWLYQKQNVSSLIKVAVEPTATAKQLSQGGGGFKPTYEFTLRLEFLPEHAAKVRPLIEKVVYQFNYPGFPEPSRTGTAPDQGFAVTYRGWGALRNVILTIHLKDGTQVPMDLDMTKLLPHIEPKMPKPATIDY